MNHPRLVTVWWDLSESAQTIDSLRAYLRDQSVDAFAEVPGLRLKTWIADSETQRWGAVILWESTEASEGPVPSRAAELIGYPPTEVHTFDVEATVQGRYEYKDLDRRGLAFSAE
jgi:trans-2,3-dihydro-3-hydroxyanthranilate isomerase